MLPYLFSSKPSWFAYLLVFLVVGIPCFRVRMSASPVSEALAGLAAFRL
jgi:hypothetical protein